ncbi:hypothetical protein P5704_025585 (plasmid) [Pseudomonas sp. FeN3W]|nr:hypothetical protein P5704_025585 [Pseudomonas sp. FeN3W]
MSDIDLSFEQLRHDIFESVLGSLGKNNYTYIHNALVYGRDPEQIILPCREDAMLLSRYGVLSLKYDVPNNYPIYFNISLTLGRLNYSVQAHKDLVEKLDLKISLTDLAAELGIKCGCREIHDDLRFEFCNDPTLVWAPTAINILRSPQLEKAFTEFVRLQADKLIVSISGILAGKGIFKETSGGIYALLMVRSMGRSDVLEDIVNADFEILSKDTREPLNVVYSIRARERIQAPLMLLDALKEQLNESGYSCSLRPAWGFTGTHPMIDPIIKEKVVEVERLVEVEKRVEVERLVEVEKLVEVEVERVPPPLDYSAFLTEPKVD